MYFFYCYIQVPEIYIFKAFYSLYEAIFSAFFLDIKKNRHTFTFLRSSSEYRFQYA